MNLHLVALGKVHQVDAPQKVVDLDDVLVGAVEEGDDVVQEAAHLRCLRLEVCGRLGQNGLDCSHGCRVVVVHGPRERGAVAVDGDVEGVAADTLAHLELARVLELARRRDHAAHAIEHELALEERAVGLWVVGNLGSGSDGRRVRRLLMAGRMASGPH
eukprot:5196812-Prymnesium_polylepis.1